MSFVVYAGYEFPRPTISSSIYAFDMRVLSGLVEAARKKYLEMSSQYVMVHTYEGVRNIDFSSLLERMLILFVLLGLV